MGLITSTTQTGHDGARAVTQHLESEGRSKVQGHPHIRGGVLNYITYIVISHYLSNKKY